MSSTGNRERKRQQSKQQIQTAALELFERQGFERTTVKQIADAAGVSPRTFFRYFPSKDDVVFGDSLEDLRELQRFVMDRPEDEPEYQALRSALIEFGSYLQSKRELLLARAKLIDNTPRLRARAAQGFEEWGIMLGQCLAERESANPDEMRHRLIAGICLGTFILAINEWRKDSTEEALSSMATSAFDTLESELKRLPGSGGGRAPNRIATSTGG